MIKRIMKAGAGVLILGIILTVVGFLLYMYTEANNLSVDSGLGFSIETPIQVQTHPYAVIGGWLVIIGLYAIIPSGIIAIVIGGILKTKQSSYQPPQQPLGPQYQPPQQPMSQPYPPVQYQPYPQPPQPSMVPPVPSPPAQPGAFCGKCGKPLPAGNMFCPSCGAPRS